MVFVEVEDRSVQVGTYASKEEAISVIKFHFPQDMQSFSFFISFFISFLEKT